jgi:hypothetical protein
VCAGTVKRCVNALGTPRERERAAVGYYEPIQARRYFDGKLDTFLSIDDFAAREKEPRRTSPLYLNRRGTMQWAALCWFGDFIDQRGNE